MADVILSDGREITFDMLKVSLREFRTLFDRNQPQDEEDVVIARAAGMDVDEYRSLPVPDWRLLAQRFFEVSRKPTAEQKNSASASSST